jgi:hypothetical protein
MPTTSFGLGGRKAGNLEFDVFLSGASDLRHLDQCSSSILGGTLCFASFDELSHDLVTSEGSSQLVVVSASGRREAMLRACNDIDG